MPSINFKGKNAVWNHHMSVPYQILEKDKKLSSKGKNEDENLIIEADNLIALKSLLPKYQGLIKCIYIDPPYNKGGEGWVYNDNVNSPLIQEWLRQGPVGSDDLTRHDKWLCMMTPRLKLLQELLSNDGIIFISIDDNELGHLINLMDEIFGDANFVDQFIIRSNPRGNQAKKHTASVHEYLLVYAKDKSLIKPLGIPVDEENYGKLDEDGKYREIGLRKRGAGARREDAPNQYYPIYYNSKSGEITTENKGEEFCKIIPKLSDGSDGRWRWAKDTVEEGKENLIVRLVKRNGSSEYDVFEKDYHIEGKISKIKSIFYEKEVNYENATEELKALFDGQKVFDYPKPTYLIKTIISIASDENAIILDSFAGSGTIAHAVLALNKESGNRKFILVQLPEEIKKDNSAYKYGFRFVHEITQDRVKKVIERDKLKIGFSYMRLGPQIDADHILSGSLPTYKEFAKYTYYLATGKTMDNEKTINENNYYVGKANGSSIYLIYEKNKEKLKGLAVTLEWAEKIHRKDSGKKIVYAPACFLDGEYLEKFNIQFVGIPYGIFEKK